MICKACNLTYPDGPRFCTECGKPLRAKEEPKVNPAHLEEYKELLDEFMEGGFLEDYEQEVLADLRQEYGISSKIHQKLLEKYNFRQNLPLKLAYNPDTVRGYGAQQNCLALIRIANLERLPLRKVQISYQLNREEYEPIELTYLRQKAIQELGLPFVPKIAGQYEFKINIMIETFKRETFTFKSARIHFQVHTHSAPSEVHIHQTGERVYGNHNINAAGSKQAEFLGGGAWKELRISPLKTATGSKKIKKPKYQIHPKFKNLPDVSRCEVHFILAGQPDRKLDICVKNAVTFGKDRSQSDLRLALEPYKPESGYSPQEVEENKRRTFGLISRLHLKIGKENGDVFIQDARSTNGTKLNKHPIPPLRNTPLPNQSRLEVGTALQLDSQLLPDDSGVLLTRPENYPQKEHLILWKMAGISDFSSGIIEPFDANKHSFAFGVLENKLCLINCSDSPLSYENSQIPSNQGIPLNQDMIFEIGPATMIIERT